MCKRSIILNVDVFISSKLVSKQKERGERVGGRGRVEGRGRVGKRNRGAAG